MASSPPIFGSPNERIKRACLCGCGESFYSRANGKKYLNETHKERHKKRRQRGHGGGDMVTKSDLKKEVKECIKSRVKIAESNTIF